MRKLLAVNGQFYTGNKQFNGKRSEAVVIKGETEFKMLLGAVFCKIMNGEMEFKRIEALDAKEVKK